MSKKKNKKIKENKKMENLFNEENTEVVNEENTEVVNEENTEVVNEENTEVVNEENAEVVNEENTEVVNEENTEVVNEVRKGIVVPSRLNVRVEPNKESDVVSIIDQNTIVSINDEINNFYFIETKDGIKGFCVKDFISIVLE